MAGIKIPISIDNANFTSAAKEAQKAVKSVSGEVRGLEKETNSATDSMKEMLKQAAAFGGISIGLAGAKEFVSQIVDVRKEMQGYSTSLNVLLGDQAKANAMFSELKDFAVTTPLMFKDLAAGAQTMLGFNIEAEKVVPTLKAIGDISMGDAGKFQSLTLAFSQMSATGKLMGQDLLQMINAGFNPLTEISRKTGKSIGALKDEMSAGSISAEMVADAFMAATQEGGKFYGMLEQQGQTLAGKLNTLQGAIDDMFNSLGAQSEGVINSAIEGATELVKNYEKVGKVIMEIVGAYGAYKGALMAVSAIQGANFGAYNTAIGNMQKEIDKYKEAIAVKTDAVSVAIEELAAKNEVSAATLAEVEAIHKEAMAEDELFASKVRAAEANGQFSHSQAEQLITMKKAASESLQMVEIEKKLAQQALDTATQRLKAAEESALSMDKEIEGYKQLISENEKLGNSVIVSTYNEQLREAGKRRNAVATEIEAAALAKETAQEHVNTLAKNANALAEQKRNIAQIASIKSMGIMQAAGVQLRNIMLSLNAAIDANPFIILAAAVAAVGYAVYKGLDWMGAFNEKMMNAQEIQDKLAAGTERLTKAQEEQRKETERLMGILRDGSSTDAEKILAYEELKKKCSVLTEQYGMEELAVIDLSKAYKTLKESQETQSTGQLVMDTQRMERVVSDLEKVMNKQARSSSAETQKYIKENGLVGQSTKEIIKALKERISANRELIDAQKKANDETAKTTVKNKAYWEGIKKKAESDRDALDVSKKNSKEWKEYTRIIAEADAELAKYSSNASKKAANEELKEKKKLSEIQRKQLMEAEREKIAIIRQTQQDNINILKDGAEKQRKQVELNYQLELDDIKKWEQDLANSKIEAAKAIFEADKDNSTKIFDSSSVDTSMSAEEQAALQAKVKLALQTYKQGLAEVSRTENQEMLEYIANFGNMYQQKLAIVKQIDQEIAETDSKWQKESLRRQKEEIERQAKRDSAYTRLNAAAVGGASVQTQLKPFMEELRRSLDAFMRTAEFSKLSQDEQNEYFNQSEMLAQMGVFSDSLESVAAESKNLATAMQNTDAAEKRLSTAMENDKKATDNLRAAVQKSEQSTLEYETTMKAIEVAMESGDVELAEQLRENVDALRENMEADKQFVDDLQTTVNETAEETAKATEAANEAAVKETKARENLTQTIIKQDKAFTDTISVFRSLSSGGSLLSMIGEQVGGVWGAIISIIGELKGDIGGFIENILNDIGGIVDTLAKQIFNGDLFKGIFNGIGSVFSGIGSFFGIGGSTEEEAKQRIEELNRSAQHLSDNISELTDEISSAKGYIETNNKIQDQQKEYAELEKNYQRQLDESQSYYGSHHSNAYYLNNAIDKELWKSSKGFGTGIMDEINAKLKEWAEANGEIASFVQSAGDFYKLSAKEWAYLRENAYDAYKWVLDQGKYDEDAKFEQLADLGEKMIQAEQKNIEIAAGFSFDSMYEEFIDTLNNMESSAEDFGENFQKNMEKKLIFNALGDKYSQRIKEIYDAYYKAVKDAPNGVLSGEQINAFREQLEQVGKEAMEERDMLLAMTGNTIAKEYMSSFDQIRSGFVELVSNLEATAEDFNATFSDIMYNALMEQKMQSEYDDIIKQWREDVNNAMQDGGLDDTKIEEFRQAYNDIIARMQKDAANIAAITGKDSNTEIKPTIEFDDIRSEFKSLMGDLNSQAEDFTENLKKKMFEALIQKELENGALGERLQEWYNDFAVFMDEKNGNDQEMYEQLMERYSEITNQSKEYANEVAGILGIAVEEVENKLSTISLDQIKNGFTSLLTGMNMDSEDFAENFKKMLYQAVITAHIEKAFSSQLDELGERMRAFVKEGGDVASEEYQQLLNDYVAIGEEASKYAQAVADKMSYTGQKAKEVEDTKIDFAYIKDGFSSLLSDMTSDAEAFGKKFNELMFEALLDKEVTSKFEGRLQEWYNDFDNFLENDGDINSKAYQDLLNRYQALGGEAASAAQALADAIGVSTEEMLERLTQTSYDSVRDQFQNLLMDMNSDSQTFAEDFTEMLQKALLNAQLTDLLDDELKTWYKQFGEVMNDGKLTDREIADLRASYNNIVQDALDRRDMLADITGYGQLKTTSQGGGSSSFQGMSQDLGSELNGRFTALQIAGESMASSMIEYITQMRSLVAISMEQNQAVQEIRNMMVYTNSYLDDILKYAKLCHSTLSQKLGTISSNTKNY